MPEQSQNQALIEKLAIKMLMYGEGQTEPEWAMGVFAKEHDGDCTNAPYACDRCLADDYIARVRAVLRALVEAGCTEEMCLQIEYACQDGYGAEYIFKEGLLALLADEEKQG